MITTPVKSLLLLDDSLNPVRRTKSINEGSKMLERRLRTVTMLEEKIRELQKRTNTKSGTLNERDIKNKAVYIEQVLHSNGFTSIKDSDKHLNSMLMKILGLLLEKRKLTHDSESNRMLVLRRCVTNDTFLQICEILQKVHDIRLSYTCFNGVCTRNPRGSLKGNEKVPLAVQRIFQVQLIVTIERSPIDLFRNLPWDTLLRKATQDVKEYMKWKIHQELERESRFEIKINQPAIVGTVSEKE